MKTFTKIVIVLSGISLIMACSKTEDLNSDFESESNLKCKKYQKPDPKTVTIPFKVDFTGNYASIDISPICGDYPWMQIINIGGGTGTLLGNFTHYFEFCCNIESGVYPGGHMKAYFVASNGDTLFVSCAGKVINGRADDQPEYVVSYFRDPFVILGGTGRFKGATGKGLTDDYNSSLDPNSHHKWRGSITLIKGKQKEK